MAYARLVSERGENFDPVAGPVGYEKIGFEVGGRVFWVGMCCSHSNNSAWNNDKKLAEEIVEALNSTTTKGISRG